MSRFCLVPCKSCGKRDCICSPSHVSDSTFSGKPLTVWSYPIKSYKEGFQAGLKKAAEIVRGHIESITELASAEVKATAKTIECIILEEMSDDSSE